MLLLSTINGIKKSNLRAKSIINALFFLHFNFQLFFFVLIFYKEEIVVTKKKIKNLMATDESITTRTYHRSIPPIYLSYSNQNGFIERYFVVKLYEQLVQNGLDEGVIWFDHQQGIHPDKVKKFQ